MRNDIFWVNELFFSEDRSRDLGSQAMFAARSVNCTQLYDSDDIQFFFIFIISVRGCNSSPEFNSGSPKENSENLCINTTETGGGSFFDSYEPELGVVEFVPINCQSCNSCYVYGIVQDDLLPRFRVHGFRGVYCISSSIISESMTECQRV